MDAKNNKLYNSRGEAYDPAPVAVLPALISVINCKNRLLPILFVFMNASDVWHFNWAHFEPEVEIFSLYLHSCLSHECFELSRLPYQWQGFIRMHTSRRHSGQWTLSIFWGKYPSDPKRYCVDKYKTWGDGRDVDLSVSFHHMRDEPLFLWRGLGGAIFWGMKFLGCAIIFFCWAIDCARIF